ncbi:MAG TPA: serine hydrolase domain-containing protein [Cyclobacteriaceae bacterium]|nr:serine hydrolase domain-containing protein [Cyclobacteriaceae bacterium]
MFQPLISIGMCSKRVFVSLTLMFCAPHFYGYAQSDNADKQLPLVANIDEYFSALSGLDAFSGAVIIVRNDTILLHKGYGLADRSKNISINNEMKFDIGSLAKQFTAAAILKLELDHKIKTSDSLQKFIKLCPLDKSNITIDQLLNHTSGLPPDIVSFTELYKPSKKTESVKRILDLPLQSKPGEVFSYSNPGYILLASIIENISGISFKEYLADKLFKPAGLTNTIFIGDELVDYKFIAHAYWDQYDEFHDTSGKFIGKAEWNALGSAGIFSTVGDLYKWFAILQTNKILTQNERQKLFTPHKGDYGYGWFIRKRNDGIVSVIYHNGSVDSYETAVRYYPGRRMFAAITSSSKIHDGNGQHDEYLNGAINILLGREQLIPPKLHGQLRPEIIGIYYDCSDPETKWRIWMDNTNQYWIAPLSVNSWKIFSENIDTDLPKLNTSKRFIDSLVSVLKSDKCELYLKKGKYTTHMFPEDWRNNWCYLETEFGPFQKAEFITYLPLFYSSARNYVFTNLHFKKQVLTVAWLCEGKKLIESWVSKAVDYPQSYRLETSSEKELMIYNPFTNSTIVGKVNINGVGDYEIEMKSKIQTRLLKKE